MSERTNENTYIIKKLPIRTPLHIYIDPSGACNLLCRFCPCNMSSYMTKERHKIMDISLFNKIVDDIKGFDDMIDNIYLFCFGEPLLNKHLPYMVNKLKSEGLCRKVSSISNGLLLEPELNSKLIDSGLDYIRISIEALSEEGYSEVAGKSIDFDKLVFGIKDYYNKSRGKGQIAVRIVNAALKDEEDAKLFYQIFKPISDFAVIDNLRDIWSDADEINMDTGGYVEKNNYYENGGKYCSEPLYSMIIHSNGLVSPCTQDWKFKKVYGDIRKDSLKALWESSELKRIQIELLENDRRDIDFCKGCNLAAFVNVDDSRESILSKIRGSL